MALDAGEKLDALLAVSPGIPAGAVGGKAR